MITIDRIDHIVLTVKSIDESCRWYERVLGMQMEIFADNRTALTFGTSKINLHPLGKEYEPKAQNPGSGTADLCFISETPIDQIIKHLTAQEIEIEDGPATKTGAMGSLLSVYIRDPDLNLIEVSNEL